MYIQLPPLKDMSLPTPHFPAPFQCVIFRNWGMAPISRIAFNTKLIVAPRVSSLYISKNSESLLCLSLLSSKNFKSFNNSFEVYS